MSRRQSRLPTSPQDVRCSYITQWFPPEPTRVASEIPRALADSGLQIRVLTGVPHYPQGDVHKGYKGLVRRRETIEGFDTLRTSEYANHSTSGIQRIANYLSWAISASILGYRQVLMSDVSLVYSSPITAASPALVGRLSAGRPYVLYIQDMWPDSMFATGYNGFIFRVLGGPLNLYCRLVYRCASRICVSSPGMKSLLIERGVNPEKILTVFNWVPASEMVTEPRSRFRDVSEPLRLLYAGNHGPAQGLESLIDCVASTPGLSLTLVGDGTQKSALIERVAATKAANIQFLSPVPAAEIPRLQAEADMQVVSLSNEPIFRSTMPSKVQSILASGLPVLAIAGGDVADVVRRANCGFVVCPGHRSELEDLLGRIVHLRGEELAGMGESGRQYYALHLSETVNASRLVDVVAEVGMRR